MLLSDHSLLAFQGLPHQLFLELPQRSASRSFSLPMTSLHVNSRLLCPNVASTDIPSTTESFFCPNPHCSCPAVLCPPGLDPPGPRVLSEPGQRPRPCGRVPGQNTEQTGLLMLLLTLAPFSPMLQNREPTHNPLAFGSPSQQGSRSSRRKQTSTWLPTASPRWVSLATRTCTDPFLAAPHYSSREVPIPSLGSHVTSPRLPELPLFLISSSPLLLSEVDSGAPGWLNWLSLQLFSGHDLVVCEIELHAGLRMDRAEPPGDALALSLSLSQNKYICN